MQFQQFVLNYEAHVIRRYHLKNAVEKRNEIQNLNGLEIIKEEATSLPREFTDVQSIEKAQSA